MAADNGMCALAEMLATRGRAEIARVTDENIFCRFGGVEA